jgi:hypothetical protein
MIEEYLTVDEVAARLKLKRKTVLNKMSSGVFLKGVHYFSPAGIGPRFKWSAVQAWLAGKPQDEAAIPMRRGYDLSTPISDLWENGRH